MRTPAQNYLTINNKGYINIEINRKTRRRK